MTKPILERRKYKRFLVPKNKPVFVHVRPSDNGMGRLIDISMDGLTFEYAAAQRPSVEPTEIDIFLADGGFCLPEIPIRSVWDLKTYDIPSTSLHNRQCGVKFGDLTYAQALQIGHFIKKHTVTQRESAPEIPEMYVRLSKN